MKDTGGIYVMTSELQQCWLGCKADTLNSAAFNVNGTANGGLPLQNKMKPLLAEAAPGQKNVARPALVDRSKIYLPPLHIKLGLIKIFVKTMDK